MPAAVADKPKPETYKMPYVEPGMTVQWSFELNHDHKFAAIVTSVGQNNVIDCLVYYPESATSAAHSGVKHKLDPRNKTASRAQLEEGTWEHTELTKRTLKVLNDLEGK